MTTKAAAGDTPRRLYVYNGGFLTQSRVRRILTLSGYDIRLGTPGPDDAVAVWGQSPTSPRGEAVAARKDAPVVRIEDAFLRSVLTGRDGEPALGLHIDHKGVHFDPGAPSDLETILLEDPLDDTALLNRARDAMAWIARAKLSKYNAFDPALPPPDPGYVLVIDQTRKDASLKASGADLNTFREMLFYAQTEHPKARIIIKTHPETRAGHREGYFTHDDCTTDRISLNDDPYAPQTLFEGAIAVYTVSSQMGFEAILAGHKPIVFGQPFYMGWGLTDDRKPLTRRQRRLTRTQLFAAAMILYPKWYDPYRDRLCTLEDTLATLEAQARSWRDDHRGWTAVGMRLWKRAPVRRFFGTYGQIRFQDAVDPTADGPHMIWGDKGQLTTKGDVHVEDGFLRSQGLGADLIPPLSLALDDLGLYYDPSQASRLETLIEAAPKLTDGQRDRALRLINRLTKARLSKYNLTPAGAPPSLPAGRRILVPGQVADDASIRLGTSDVTTNAALLQATRAANPAAVILYKPHPDVERGLRDGAVPDAETYADAILTDMSASDALDLVDDVWTMTSTLGFEALLRDKRVTCLGTPFYAGWGLTDDRAKPLTRRAALPDVIALAHAALIDYPRYFDPVTGLACPVEVVVDRLEAGDLPTPGRWNRVLAKLQGAFASYAHLWR